MIDLCTKIVTARLSISKLEKKTEVYPRSSHDSPKSYPILGYSQFFHPLLTLILYTYANLFLPFVGKIPSNELQIYTWLDASLKELTSLVREVSSIMPTIIMIIHAFSVLHQVNPDARRKGTFFDFAVIYPQGKNFVTRDIGTTVSGQKGPDDSKTLKDCRFVIGDYIDIAITPPNAGFGGRRGGGGGGGRDDRRGRDDNNRRFRPY